MVPLKYLLTEDPDDLYYPEGKPLAFSLLENRWFYLTAEDVPASTGENKLPAAYGEEGMPTHHQIKDCFMRMIYDEPYYADLKIFPNFISEKEKKAWLAKANKQYMKNTSSWSDEYRTGFDLEGRLTLAGQLRCSLWQNLDKIREYIPQLVKLFTHLKLDVNQYSFEPLDAPEYLSFNELKGTQQLQTTKSPEEIRALLKKQHLDPKAKRALRSSSDTTTFGAGKQAMKAAKLGYPSAAAYHFATRQESKQLNEAYDPNARDGWLSPGGDFSPLGWEDLHNGWAYRYLVKQKRIPHVLSSIDVRLTGSEEEDAMVEKAWENAAEILYNGGWQRISIYQNRIYFSSDSNVPLTTSQQNELRDMAIEQGRQLINGYGDIVFDPKNTSTDDTPEQVRFAMNYRPEKPAGMSTVQYNFMRGESVITEQSEGDGWMDPHGAIHSVPWEKTHHEWAYYYLLKHNPVDVDPGHEDDQAAWDDAADMLYDEGWLRIVRFPNSLHFTRIGADTLPSSKQQKELKNLAIEENRVIINDISNTLFFDPRATAPKEIEPPKKSKFWMNLRLAKPAGMSTAQYNFMRGESVKPITEKAKQQIRNTRWLSTIKKYSQLPAEWRAKYPFQLWGRWNMKVKRVALGIVYKGQVEAKALGPGNKYKYLEVWDLKWQIIGRGSLSQSKHWSLGNNNVVEWEEKPTRKDMDLVDSYLIQKGVHPFSHGVILKLGPSSFESAIEYRTPDYYTLHPIQIASTTQDYTQSPSTVSRAQWNYMKGESFQQFAEDTQQHDDEWLKSIESYDQLPEDWKAKYPQIYWDAPIIRIALGILWRHQVEAKALPHQYQDISAWSLKWNILPHRSNYIESKVWSLGANKVVQWDERPTELEMDLVDIYLTQRGFHIFSHGSILRLSPTYYGSAIKYRTPDHYKLHPTPTLKPETQPTSSTPMSRAQWNYMKGESYKQNPSFIQYCEDMFAGSGGTFGTFSTPYAAGDARVPFVIGAIQTRPGLRPRRRRRRKRK